MKGFTMLEILISMAIIGLLATIAIPSYSAYQARAKTSEAVNLMAGMKGALLDYELNNGRFPSVLTSVSATTQGRYTQSITIDGVCLKARMKSINGVIELCRDGNGWRCQSTMKDSYLPRECR